MKIPLLTLSSLIDNIPMFPSKSEFVPALLDVKLSADGSITAADLLPLCRSPIGVYFISR